MHYIQKHILDQLRSADTMRYAQINSQDIESGHFRYHLSELIRDGYVEQSERGTYGLSPEGRKFVDRLSEGRIRPHAMPKVITYTLLKDGKDLLLYRKDKQPYIHLLNMVGGKLHEGETSRAAAIREVREKTGITDIEPELVGIFEVRITSGGQLFTHVIAYVYTAIVTTIPAEAVSLVRIPTAELRDTTGLAPDFLPIYGSIHDPASVRTEALSIEI
jgi:ADP-ribose pyrophosphatase YjhB (NUDIX family)